MPRRAWVRKRPRGVKIKKSAPTYSPAGEGSTLGRRRFHFSVRDGKRWFTSSLGALLCFEGAYTRLKAIFGRRGYGEAFLFTHRLTSLIGPRKGGVEDGVIYKFYLLSLR